MRGEEDGYQTRELLGLADQLTGIGRCSDMDSSATNSILTITQHPIYHIAFEPSQLILGVTQYPSYHIACEASQLILAITQHPSNHIASEPSQLIQLSHNTYLLAVT